MKKNWELIKIGNIADIYNGGTPDTKIKEYWNGKNLWITPKDMGKLFDKYVDDTERKITDSGLKNSSAKILPINSIILSSRAPIGHLAINKKEISTNQGCKGIVPKRNLNTLYLYYFLKKSVVMLNNLGSGTTFKELSGKKLADVKIPIPPFSEQKHIVAILDEAFDAIAKAKKNAEKNLVNVRELFESYLNRIFTNPENDWEEKKLGDITTKIGSGATPLGGEKSYKANGISLIRSLNVHDYSFKLKDLAFIDDKQSDLLSNVIVESGDVLLNITGASIARCCIIPDNVLPARVNQHVSIIRLMKNIILPEYLHYFLISKVIKDKLLLTGEKNGATRQALTKALIENFKVYYPSLKEQKSIVKKLDELSLEIKQLEKIYKDKINNLKELKKSILNKAFIGEL